ncbi:MAG: aminomethyl-transferring glycine dehydrogenase subunit GcvPA [Myxococcales bacterium]|jgi:glycine dehydrogenase subunit 1|nr:aminomethyl-transferring glycine dehydrogenase subunit GcvPA [Myxococcales bacterium]
MRYLPHTPEEVREMLAAAKRGSIDELFESIPESARFQGRLDVPPALGEAQLMRHLQELASRNTGARMLSFLGCGSYDHHVPPAVDQLLLRSEFYTAYTPYQPEVAQGTLQAIWEFQTMVSELYGLPLANASLYDGASATAEAVLMARRLTKRDGVLVSGCVHPEYRHTTRTYLSGRAQDEYVDVALGPDGRADLAALEAAIDERTAAVVVGYPSFVGPLTDLEPIARLCHDRGALLVVAVPEPYALALADAPGGRGADIVVGEGQPLACPPQFGGPGVGLFACRDDKKFLQQLPGRVCGETVDVNGKRGYVLTLSTREQHIRRERATSNICTNQGLVALAFAVRVSLLGKTGFVEVARRCLAKARYLRDQLTQLPGVGAAFGDAPFFNEFAVRFSGHTAAAVLARLEQAGIVGGYDLGRTDPAWSDRLLVAVTEKHARADLDEFVTALRTALADLG